MQLNARLNKFFGIEMLDYIADEAVQIHGGYGFIQEYEVERIYRDSRINRIFEGTNEINRLLVPGTFTEKGNERRTSAYYKKQKLYRKNSL